MQTFDIIKTKELKNKSYRVAKICDQFDYTSDIVKEHFNGNIDIPDQWNIGVIVGKSGTGKSTIAKELFGKYFCEFKYDAECVVDDFDKSIDEKELTKMFSAVGFACVPSWLKPYSVLSNGEKMRVDLARALLMDQEIIVFDEYTSVVDREVAQLGALATHNAIKKTNKKFIAVTCHFDIIDWLQPDWVFSTDTMEMLPRGLLRRPEIRLEIRRKKGYWNLFRRYHYLMHSLNKAAHEYVAIYNGKPIAFYAVLNFPNRKYKPMWKGHRLVVLPDYQGIGIGILLCEFVADLYHDKGEYFGNNTSHNVFAGYMLKSKKWKLIRYGKMLGNSENEEMKYLKKTESTNRNSYSFRYIGCGQL